MKTLRTLSFGVAVMTMSAISAWATSGECALTTPKSLILTGSTDAKMLACIRLKNLAAVEIVKVDSGGGSVKDALEIGDLLAPLKAEFIITKQCSSSCANFFLPIARKITLQKNAAILLHGSIDPGTAHKAIQNGMSSKVWDTVERQQNYAVKYNIHRGWLLYRDTFKNGGSKQFEYINGQLKWKSVFGSMKVIMVEERMLRSCLPNVEVTPYFDTAIDRARLSKKKRRKLIKQGVRSSGTWACIGPGSAHLPMPDFAALRAKSNQPITK